MKPITLQNIKNIYQYNRHRVKIQEKIIALKRRRTLQLGPSLLITFENRDTIQYYIHEAARAERALDDSDVLQLLEIYNPLLPGSDELCGLIQLYITEKEAIQSVLHQFQFLEQNHSIWFEINDNDRVYAQFDSDTRSKQPAYYIRFQFSEHTTNLFCNSSTAVSLVIRHDSYRATSPVRDDLREELIRDLTEG